MSKTDTPAEKDGKKQVNLQREIRRDWMSEHKGLIIGTVVCLLAAVIAVVLIVKRPWVSEAHVLEQTAAIVDGENITEQDVADYVDKYRRYIGKTDDAEWATFMDENSLTAEGIRSQALSRLEQQSIIKKAAKSEGITASKEEIDEKVSAEREKADLVDDDAAWVKWLSDMGYDEASYRDEMEYGIIEEKYIDTQVAPSEPSDYSLQSEASSNVESYTGRKGYEILVKVDKNATASTVTKAEEKAKGIIKDLGENPKKDDFIKKADEVSKDSDVTARELQWDCLVAYDSALQSALDELDAGKMVAEPVRTSDGYAIVFCLETFLADDEGQVSVNDMPAPILKALKAAAYESINKNPRDTFLMLLTYNHTVDTTDMPEGLPYDVDMSKSTYHAKDTDTSTSDDGSTITLDGSDGTTASADGSTVVTTETTGDVTATTSGEGSSDDQQSDSTKDSEKDSKEEKSEPAVSPSDPTVLQTYGDSSESDDE